MLKTNKINYVNENNLEHDYKINTKDERDVE